MVTMNLCLWAFQMGRSTSIFAPFIYFMSELIFIGMVELASQLSDPFGQDEVDFPINDWLSSYLETGVDFNEQDYWADHDLDDILPDEQALEPAAFQFDLFDSRGQDNVCLARSGQYGHR